MKIITLANHMGIGGVQRVAKNFALGFQALGQEGCVVVSDPSAGDAWQQGDLQFQNELTSAGIPIFTGEGNSGAILERVGSEWGRPDVVHLHSNNLSRPLVEAVRSTFPDALLAETNIWGHPNEYRDLLDLTMQLSRWCEYMYCTSGFPGVWEERKAVVPNLMETDGFHRPETTVREELRRELGIPAAAVLLGRVGRNSDTKWSPLVLEALKAAVEAGIDAYLLLLGVPEILRTQISLAPARIRERIRVVDRVTNPDALAAHYSVMDLFVHAARRGETFGNVLAEAALCEVPVVTLATPYRENSQGDVVGHGEGGVVALDEETFIRSVVELSARPEEERRAIGTAARRRAMNRYGVEPVSRLALETFRAHRSDDAYGDVYDGAGTESTTFSTNGAVPTSKESHSDYKQRVIGTALTDLRIGTGTIGPGVSRMIKTREFWMNCLPRHYWEKTTAILSNRRYNKWKKAGKRG